MNDVGSLSCALAGLRPCAPARPGGFWSDGWGSDEVWPPEAASLAGDLTDQPEHHAPAGPDRQERGGRSPPRGYSILRRPVQSEALGLRWVFNASVYPRA